MDVDPQRAEAGDVDVDAQVELAVLDEVRPADVALHYQLLLLGQLRPALDDLDAGAARRRRLSARGGARTSDITTRRTVKPAGFGSWL